MTRREANIIIAAALMCAVFGVMLSYHIEDAASASSPATALRAAVSRDPLMIRLTPTDVLARPYADGSVVWECADELQYIRWSRVAVSEGGGTAYRARLQFGRSYDYARSYSLLLHADEVQRIIRDARARGDREIDLSRAIDAPDNWEAVP